jgi:hypothetical protein
MPSTEPPDDGAAEDIQESAEAALAATSRDLAASLFFFSLSRFTPNWEFTLVQILDQADST